ncbi:hypothetical protein G4H71_12870 [Rhodococcus triatomae]|uniref:Vancomycin resistance protein YoaR, contains peptidoglycan-binding and VanW domains n=1 Tax=Rhodococcus triatomae TaxID=300028 RepID=A0A1G8GV63_9NOCA|nr:VanW family protein [Rhodococcus triatomae]QNG20291.1 hypothetical protein G4H72_17510 [Rhodococcus triatomae]QNG23794.1 hypothetical protein G4H71_12870 [Rhodococcus triatomae]SDH98298.1 Vancomycin resistance protein YoaR, contains peptidoglycan-binding and VanW domains [Rhodococcus triatomae]
MDDGTDDPRPEELPTTPISDRSQGDGSEDPTQVIPAVPDEPAPPRAYEQVDPEGAGAATEQFTAPQAEAASPAGSDPSSGGGAGGSGGDGSDGGVSGAVKAAPWAKIVAVAGGAAALLGLGYAIDLAVASGSVARGTTVAGVDVGGMSTADAEQTLRAALEPRANEPVEVTAGDVTEQIVPAEAGLGVDWAATLDRIDSQPLNPWTRLTSFFVDREAGVSSTVDEAALAGAIDGLRGTADRAVREGNIVFEGATPVPVTPAPGQQIDGEGTEELLTERWAFAEPIDLPVESVEVTVSQDSVDRALADVAVPAASADLVVSGRDGVTATSPRDRIGALLRFEPDGDGGLEPVYDFEAATGILAPQLAPTEREPKDAEITLSGGSPTVVPAVVGDLVQWPETLEGLPQALAGTHRIDAVYGPVEPELTTEAAESLGVREVIGEFTTGGFSSASGVNIRLAAASLDGALVLPGETFSLNGHTGPRGTAQGYVESGIINHGRPDTAVGGGVSQVATTLYNASYFAGMEDVEHTEHSYYISRYPEAREATVFEGAIDLKFRNPTDTGVLIQAIGGSSQLTIRFWGTKTVDVQSVTGSRSRPTQPDTITLPAGDACVPSSGSPGFTSSDTRIITDVATGREISRNTRTVRYDPVPTVECESSDPAPAAPPADGPPERAPAPEPGGGGGGQAPAAAPTTGRSAPSSTPSAPAGETTTRAPRPTADDDE